MAVAVASAAPWRTTNVPPASWSWKPWCVGLLEMVMPIATQTTQPAIPSPASMALFPLIGPKLARTIGELRITAAPNEGLSSPLGSRTRSFRSSIPGVPPTPACQPPYQPSITTLVTTYTTAPAGQPSVSRLINGSPVTAKARPTTMKTANRATPRSSPSMIRAPRRIQGPAYR